MHMKLLLNFLCDFFNKSCNFKLKDECILDSNIKPDPEPPNCQRNGCEIFLSLRNKYDIFVLYCVPNAYYRPGPDTVDDNQ